MLSADVARCDGKTYVPIRMDFFSVHRECASCLRRTDRPDHPRVPFMDPPEGEPCPMRLEAEHAD